MSSQSQKDDKELNDYLDDYYKKNGGEYPSSSSSNSNSQSSYNSSSQYSSNEREVDSWTASQIKYAREDYLHESQWSQYSSQGSQSGPDEIITSIHYSTQPRKF